MLPCAALADPAGPAFFFLLFFTRPVSPSYVDELAFSHPGLPLPPDSRTTAPHGSNRAGNPFRWCRSPTWPQKPHTGSHKAKFGFHRLFLVRFFYGREAKSLSSL